MADTQLPKPGSPHGGHGGQLCGWHKTWVDLLMSPAGKPRASHMGLPCRREAKRDLPLEPSLWPPGSSSPGLFLSAAPLVTLASSPPACGSLPAQMPLLLQSPGSLALVTFLSSGHFLSVLLLHTH